MPYRYTLQPYKGKSSRYTCPQCKAQRRCFSRYIDIVSGQHLAPHVGRCSRQDNRGYHFTPKQFFEENGQIYKSGKQSGSIDVYYPSFIPSTDMQNTLRCYEQNNLVLFLRAKLGDELTGELIARYHIGTSRKWPGATIYWQVDERGICRTGKIMLYDAYTGKRVKEPYSHISWVHTLKDKVGRQLYPDFHLQQCLFGAHLLAEGSKKLVVLVESEKTALLGAEKFPDRLWLATGGKEGLTKAKCGILRHRDILLYPDVNSYEHWAAQAKELFLNYSVSNVLERLGKDKPGWDLGDWLLDT